MGTLMTESWRGKVALYAAFSTVVLVVWLLRGELINIRVQQSSLFGIQRQHLAIGSLNSNFKMPVAICTRCATRPLLQHIFGGRKRVLPQQWAQPQLLAQWRRGVSSMTAYGQQKVDAQDAKALSG